MLTEKKTQFLVDELDQLRQQGLFRPLRVLGSAQDTEVVVDGKHVLNLSSNNYLGLTTHPRLKAAMIEATQQWGAGSGAVRTIAGTMTIHEELERRLAEFKHTEASLVFQSGFTANLGVLQSLVKEGDVIISDELNHASIIDGIRLSKARRLRYRNRDMADLEQQLKSCQDARRRLIATDGVFSMDGYVAPLDAICELADRYDAMVMVDDSHAVGFIGPTGRGTPELHDVTDRVDIVTGTLGKALGGASGGYTSGRREIVEMLRQRSRPYLFSNTVAPAVAGGSLAVLDLLERGDDLRARLRENTSWFRTRMTELGFDVLPGDHPIVPVMIGDAALASRMADVLLGKGVYVIGFSYPVVPVGKARIRTQVSAAHTRDELELATSAFDEARAEVGM